MEEDEDIIPETIPDAEYEEEVEEIPEPPPLKRASNLTETLTCEGCGKSLSLHAYKYSHRCKARAPDEPVKVENVNTGQLKEALKEVKPSLTESKA